MPYTPSSTSAAGYSSNSLSWRFSYWGDVLPQRWTRNQRALLHGGELRSVYHTPESCQFEVVTTADRAQTMVFLRSKMKLDKKMQNAATDAAVTRMMQNKWRCGVKA